MARSPHAWSGLLPVWKPVGLRSAEVVELLKNMVLKHHEASLPSGANCKVGHGGTLDSFAEGVLVIGFGDGTKQLQYLNQSSSTKEYVACGQLGVATDTYDPLGAETRRAPYDHVTAEGLREVLQSKFLGKIMQRPPAYSALKKDGVRFSDLNRSGVDVRPEARERHVSDIQLLKFEPPFFTISVTCNSGTYVRSLVYDIAENMDTVAHVRTLQRLRVTRFTHHNALRQESWTLGHVYGALLRQRKEQERMLQDGVDPETAL